METSMNSKIGIQEPIGSVVHSHWLRNVEAWLSLVESVAGAIKNQLSHSKPPRGILLAPRWFFIAPAIPVKCHRHRGGSLCP